MTKRSHETRHALAAEFVYLINTSTAVLAGIALAVVDVRLALGSGEALRAHALETVDAVHAAALVLARVRVAIVDLVLAVHAAVTGSARAFIPGARLRALSAVLAGLIHTGRR